MKRYTRLLCRAYQELGWQVILASPPSKLSSRTSSAHLRKWISYVEKFIWFPWVAKYQIRGADILHVADHSDAIWLLQLGQRTPALVTCHDLIAVRAALGEIPLVRIDPLGRIYQRLVLAGLQRAWRVASVSTETASDVERLTRATAHLLPNPLDPSLDGVLGSSSQSSEARRPYLLVVSSVGYRKRREKSVHAWSRLGSTATLHGAGLVIVGPPLTADEDQSVPQHSRDRIMELHNVSDAELSELYRGCAATLVLSQYEGFGWPIVESQAHGKVPLVTDDPVFRSTGGDGAVYVDPEQFESFGQDAWESLARQLTDERVAGAARRNVERYRWPDFKRNLCEVVGSSLSPERADQGAVRARR
ncbi:glycosyltransferase [Kineosporia sp. A_224]|uniref:glycosyltransferase n=1 Tax=Kineosporia sp. A_224 TaxID=1962180 RepID=UPI0013044276|nr:glycosyltransferase [Kineosporia sp. A_224]